MNKYRVYNGIAWKGQNTTNYASTTPSLPSTWTGVYIGRDPNLVANPNRVWGGNIAEVIIFNTILSTNDRSVIDKALMSKYGL
jgi:hypothetical protein